MKSILEKKSKSARFGRANYRTGQETLLMWMISILALLGVLFLIEQYSERRFKLD